MTDRLIVNPVDQVPEIFLQHQGIWQGEYIKTDSSGHFSHSFTGTFTVEINGIEYQQKNYYEYADGTSLTLNFSGQFSGGILTLFSSNYAEFSAIAWDAGQGLIGFNLHKVQDGNMIKFFETINLLSPNYRVRSTQAFKNGKFDGISFIEETRQNASI
mgnify:CR=1 FL=1